MKFGDLVEVNQVWAAGGSRGPLRHWFGDYEFVRHEKGGKVIVTPTKGFMKGVEVRFSEDDVRPARGRETSHARTK